MDTDRPAPSESDAVAPQGRLAAATPGLCRGLTLLFFLLLAAHVTISINPRILYGADEAAPEGKAIPLFPIYRQGAAFFLPFLATPGGVTEYVGANLSQYFGARYGGAVILTLAALAMFWLTGRLISLLGGQRTNALRLVGPVLLVMVWNSYSFLLADQIALLAAMAAACYYLRLPEKPATRAMVFVPALVAFYYLVGAAVIPLALMCGLAELIDKRRAIGGLYLVVGGLAPLAVGALAFGLDPSHAHVRLVGMHPRPVVAAAAWRALLAFPVVLTVGLALRNRWAQADADQSDSKKTHNAGWLLGPSVAMLVVGIIVATATLDRNVRTFRWLCFATKSGAWNAAILAGDTAARTWPEGMYTARTCRTVNRALYETKLLGAEMFAYPQSPGGGLLPVPYPDEPFNADTLMRLGAVDSARWLSEASLDQWGDRPFLVALLAKIAIVQRDWEAAERYLLILSKDITHGAEAKELLAKVQRRDPFREDADIQAIRANWLPGHVFNPRDVQGTLEALVRHNPKNQMAFEYLMAHYLLTLQLDVFARKVGQISQFGYQYMPTQFAEALVLHYSLTGQWQAIDDLPRDPVTLERSQRFIALVRQHGDNRRALAEAVSLEMPTSYFGYFFRASRIVPTGP